MVIPDPSIQWLFWGPQNTSAILCIIQVIHPSIGGSLLILGVVTIFYPPPLKGWRCEMSKPKTSKHLLVPSTSDLKGIWRILDDEGKWEISFFFPFLRICRFRSFSVAGEIPGTEDRMCQAARRRLRCGCVCWYQRSDLGAGFYTPEIFTWNQERSFLEEEIFPPFGNRHEFRVPC